MRQEPLHISIRAKASEVPGINIYSIMPTDSIRYAARESGRNLTKARGEEPYYWKTFPTILDGHIALYLTQRYGEENDCDQIFGIEETGNEETADKRLYDRLIKKIRDYYMDTRFFPEIAEPTLFDM